MVDIDEIVVMVENRDKVFAEMEGYICKECKERIKGKGNISQLNFKNTRTDVFWLREFRSIDRSIYDDLKFFSKRNTTFCVCH